MNKSAFRKAGWTEARQVSQHRAPRTRWETALWVRIGHRRGEEPHPATTGTDL